MVPHPGRKDPRNGDQVQAINWQHWQCVGNINVIECSVFRLFRVLIVHKLQCSGWNIPATIEQTLFIGALLWWFKHTHACNQTCVLRTTDVKAASSAQVLRHTYTEFLQFTCTHRQDLARTNFWERDTQPEATIQDCSCTFAQTEKKTPTSYN